MCAASVLRCRLGKAVPLSLVLASCTFSAGRGVPDSARRDATSSTAVPAAPTSAAPDTETSPRSSPRADSAAPPPPQPALQPASPFDTIDAILARFGKASIAFNTPSSLYIGEPRTIELRLSPTMSADSLRVEIHEPGTIDTARVDVSTDMDARLTGSGFKIESQSAERQLVSATLPTVWRWSVEPSEAGRHALHLTLTAHYKVAGETRERSVQTFDREIDVHVRMLRRVADFTRENWKWLWTTMLVPVAGWFAAKWRNKRAPRRRAKSRAHANR
jgi:hypothetical protein